MVLHANFAEDKDISDERVIAPIPDSLWQSGADVVGLAGDLREPGSSSV